MKGSSRKNCKTGSSTPTRSSAWSLNEGQFPKELQVVRLDEVAGVQALASMKGSSRKNCKGRPVSGSGRVRTPQ